MQLLSAGCGERKGKGEYTAWVVGQRDLGRGNLSSCYLCSPSEGRGAALKPPAKPQDAPAAFLEVSSWAAEPLHRAKAWDYASLGGCCQFGLAQLTGLSVLIFFFNQ